MSIKNVWARGLLTLAMAASVVTPVAAAEQAASSATNTGTGSGSVTGSTSMKTITLFHTNDIHGRVESTKDNIGYAEMAAWVNDYRKSQPNTLLIDAGDTFHGQTIANLVRGESVVNVMNAAGYDVMAAGNHDFNYGTQRLVELSKLTKFPVLSANVKTADGKRLLEPYMIKEVDGVKLGIFGLTTPETAYKTHPKNVEGITFVDPEAEAKAIVAELKDKADVIIAIAHVGMDESSVDKSLDIAKAVPEIDVIIDGHSHTELPTGMVENGVLIAQAGEYLKNIGRVDLTIENGKVKSKTAALVMKKEFTDKKIAPDQAVLDIVNAVKKEQDAVLKEVVGTTSVKLVGDREVVRVGESNLGNLITDAMLSETGADVALTNGGGIRASIEAGSITKGQVITVLPFGNYIQTKKVTGADLKAALEHGVSAYPESLGAFPHVSGMTFEFDAAQPKGSRVTAVLVKGQPLDLNKTYVLATNDFMAAGGDNYTMFKSQPLLNDYSSLEESLITHIRKLGMINAAVEGRIKVKAAPAAAAQPAAGSTAAPAGSMTEAAPAVAKAYIVKSGDSLWKIAKLNKTTWQTLQKLNKLSNPNLIFPGQQIVLP
ncbi:5'-nucleotidase C-terminal domain-containing protein [Paenibacillus sp. YYML68]|uniref:5'-nucleotidase C-terminal domain-containing protein n=1 Tax=Paenibacillus sp. YYML68 TaxID=2909250 RepID=UPI00248FCB0D|nr:5'-nucleotidase C-terminal domain-containing protein [Paenibacillus sp. YYML68]